MEVPPTETPPIPVQKPESVNDEDQQDVDLELLSKIQQMKMLGQDESPAPKQKQKGKRPPNIPGDFSCPLTTPNLNKKFKVVSTTSGPQKRKAWMMAAPEPKYVKPTAAQWKKDQEHNAKLPVYDRKKLDKFKPPPIPEGTMSDDPNVACRQCKLCYQIFPAVDKLTRHLRSHTTEAEAKCTLCNQNIKYKYNLKNHMKTCQNKQRVDSRDDALRKSYPIFMEQLDAAAKDPSLRIPSLKSTPFTMDKYGCLIGFDNNLDIQLDQLIPNFNPNHHLEVAEKNKTELEAEEAELLLAKGKNEEDDEDLEYVQTEDGPVQDDTNDNQDNEEEDTTSVPARGLSADSLHSTENDVAVEDVTEPVADPVTEDDDAEINIED